METAVRSSAKMRRGLSAARAPTGLARCCMTHDGEDVLVREGAEQVRLDQEGLDRLHTLLGAARHHHVLRARTPLHRATTPNHVRGTRDQTVSKEQRGTRHVACREQMCTNGVSVLCRPGLPQPRLRLQDTIPRNRDASPTKPRHASCARACGWILSDKAHPIDALAYPPLGETVQECAYRTRGESPEVAVPELARPMHLQQRARV